MEPAYSAGHKKYLTVFLIREEILSTTYLKHCYVSLTLITHNYPYNYFNICPVFLILFK